MRWAGKIWGAVVVPPPYFSCGWQANVKVLWAMPVLQMGFLAFFSLDAILHFWLNWWLLLLCLCTGPPRHTPSLALKNKPNCLCEQNDTLVPYAKQAPQASTR
jgi:hypothetical protein